MVKSFSEVRGQEVSYKIVYIKPDDVAKCYEDSKKANKEPGWKAKYEIKEMCKMHGYGRVII